MRRPRAIDDASTGETHLEVARNLNNLALLLLATNRLAETEPPMLEGGDLAFTHDTGHEHPHLGPAIENYVGLLTTMGETTAICSGDSP